MVLIGVDARGTLFGARVIRHQETPGLGDKIEIAKARWIEDFKGKSLTDPSPDKWGVKKDGGVFDQFAGATITIQGPDLIPIFVAGPATAGMVVWCRARGIATRWSSCGT